MKIKYCFGCGSNSFIQNIILWDDLIKAWGLNTDEVKIINEQQGYSCENCGMNLRSNILAKTIMERFNYCGILTDFCDDYKNLRLLEINEAGSLHQYLKKIKNLTLTTYPDIDMCKLPYRENKFDLVIHSDTLEHVEKPISGLKECHRVLKPGGTIIYTVPVVVTKVTKRGKDINKSYHGDKNSKDYLVMTEYGADFWTDLINAGFSNCKISTLNYPAGIAISADK